MRITIGGPPKHKPAYQLADRVKCRECGKQGSGAFPKAENAQVGNFIQGIAACVIRRSNAKDGVQQNAVDARERHFFAF